VDAETGWLREAESKAFSGAMQGVIDNKAHLHTVGTQGRTRVENHFSFDAFGAKLEQALIDLLTGNRSQGRSFLSRLAVAFHFSLALGVLYWMTFGVTFP